MKKILTLAFLSVLAVTAMAKMPAQARKLVNSTRVEILYDAMDAFDAKFPDSFSDFEYSCSAHGRIFFGRRIMGKLDFPPLYTADKMRSALEKFKGTTIDSIYALLEQERYYTYMASGSAYPDKAIKPYYACAYRYNPAKPVGDFEISDALAARSSAPDGYVESGALSWKDDYFMIAQEVIVDTDTRCGAPDMSAIARFFNSMPDRQKKGRAHIARKKTRSADDWRKLYALFCAHVWTRKNISISYSRADRTISLTDRANCKVYTARYRENVLTLEISPR